jgi:hypothetical protein
MKKNIIIKIILLNVIFIFLELALIKISNSIVSSIDEGAFSPFRLVFYIRNAIPMFFKFPICAAYVMLSIKYIARNLKTGNGRIYLILNGIAYMLLSYLVFIIYINNLGPYLFLGDSIVVWLVTGIFCVVFGFDKGLQENKPA